jgi:two-component system, NtrC family, nitrogen regulation sensor histidine kinase NtrY
MDLTEELRQDNNLASLNKSNKILQEIPGEKNHSAPSHSRQLRKVFRPKVALRLLIICALGCITGILIYESTYWMGAIWTGLATVALFYETIGFVDQSERKLHSFLQALHQSDFSVTFSEKNKSPDYDLHHAFNQLNETFKNLRSEKESQHQLLQIIVESAAVPMICFDENGGEVYLMNDAARRLLNIPFLQQMRALWRVDPSLPDFLLSIRDGEKESLKLVLHGKPFFLSVTSRHIVFKARHLKVIAFHDVSSELAMREAETWQKLLRVLTHEISNSAIPLATLSAYICELMRAAEREVRILSDEERDDVLTSLKTIEQRSKSLKEFVQNFRSVNQIPEPVLLRVSVHDVISEIEALFSKEFQDANIKLKIHAPAEPTFIFADRSLTMQVLINLIKNAMESMSNFKDRKTISLTVDRMASFVNLSVSDTGCGITAEDLEQIFIPFYSTKKSGSGIGLSISQQIMQKQKGDISVQSVFGKGSMFTLTFAG